MKPFFVVTIGAALAALPAALVPAHAGDGNALYIVQDSAGGGLGNTLFLDQSAASGSLVAGNAAGDQPARQEGAGNRADITLEGEGASVVLLQSNPGPVTSASGLNTATLEGGSLASLILEQTGSGNDGTLSVGGLSNAGALYQLGDDNTGAVSVTGTGNSGTLSQEGDGNSYALSVGGQNATVVYQQIGNGLSAAGTGPVVVSNGGTVTITQRAIGN